MTQTGAPFNNDSSNAFLLQVVDFPHLPFLQRCPANLPLLIINSIGRDREIREVKCCLWSTQLFTLTGQSGCEKLHLFLPIATNLPDTVMNETQFIELAQQSLIE